MSDEKNDVVEAKKYNEVIEAHNSLKTRYDKIEQELKSMKDTQMQEEAISKQKQVWEQEKVELKKQMEDMNKKLEEVKATNTVISKSVMNTGSQPSPSEDLRKKIDAVIPNVKKRFDNMHSKIGRMVHYKSPMTKEYSNQELGMALSLHATMQKVAPETIPVEAASRAVDIKIPRS